MNAPVKAVDAESAVGDVAVAITVQTQISERRTIIMQTYLPRDADASWFHKTVDKLSRVVDRQQAKHDLEQARRHLETLEDSLAKLEDDFKRIDLKNAQDWKRAHKKGEPTLSSTELQAKVQTEQNIKELRKRAEKVKVDIAQYEADVERDD